MSSMHAIKNYLESKNYRIIDDIEMDDLSTCIVAKDQATLVFAKVEILVEEDEFPEEFDRGAMEKLAFNWLNSKTADDIIIAPVRFDLIQVAIMKSHSTAMVRHVINVGVTA